MQNIASPGKKFVEIFFGSGGPEEVSMWLIQIFDVEPDLLRDVENALRKIVGVTIASALRDQHAYIVVEAPNESDAILVQHAVANIDPTAIVVHTTEGTDASPETVEL